MIKANTSTIETWGIFQVSIVNVQFNYRGSTAWPYQPTPRKKRIPPQKYPASSDQALWITNGFP